MRKAFPVFVAVLLAGCGGGETAGSGSNHETASGALEDAAGTPTPPGVSPTAAPGVAFNYRYAFRLPGLRISAVQEQHAAACEKLGVSRCRITGMHYEQNGEDDIEAQLAFKLDPALARAFGREGIGAVTRAGGELRSADITGTDVGAEIAAGNQSGAQIGDELSRIEQQLARPGLSASERAELQRQAQELRASARTNQVQQSDRRAQLASTPMVFVYQAGDTGGPIASAARDSLKMLSHSIATLLVIIVTLLPWAIFLLLLWLVWRWANRRFLGGGSIIAAPAAATPPEA
ncbi:DUF4349 domain-containing protein [Sphingosinicella sp. BN140058]|uniref:DUF4349 domain-containing protein n=1 Tax=Sphingosinicella sp. BN140058 TaxID=1892855 RepID=UPI001013A316|nr:DUF4349 domain-containing protein [Sphingosinicella sp. BN140058]QAY76578.1 DUF4349 domain-containing protein [Sphingosinicella sp. BN140058]